MRTINTIRNATVGTVMQLLSMIVSFIARAVFARTLAVEYLGVESVFTDLISMLSIAELGFSTAIMYSLFHPLNNQDFKKVNSIMKFYKRVYVTIGLTIFMLGVILLPFLKILVNDVPTITENIYLIFILFLLNSVISYFFAYKQTLISATQNDYIVQIVTKSFTIISNLIQIVLLIVTRNFTIYLIIKIITTFLINWYLSYTANKLFPYLDINNAENIDHDELRDIKKNIFAMFFHKIGYRIVFSTDNIFISVFSTIANAGKYSNYNLLTNSIALLIDNVLNASLASVGDLKTEDDLKKAQQIYKHLLFMNYFTYAFFSTILMVMMNDFIDLWLGKDYMLSMLTVLLIVANFYIHGMRRTTIIFRDSWGLFYYDRYKPILEIISNLIFQTILGLFFGLNGIVFGTSLTILATSFWIEPYILYKYGFNSSSKSYFLKYLSFAIKLIIVSLVMILLSGFITVTSFYILVIKGIILALATLILMLIVNIRDESLQFYYGLVKNFIFKR